MSERQVTIDGRDSVVSLTREGDQFLLRSGDREDRVQLHSVRDGEIEILHEGRKRIVPFLRDGEEIRFLWGGESILAEVAVLGKRKKTRHREHSMSAPMPAMVLKVMAEVGQNVVRGAPLIVLEAMKMEHQITAASDGTVAAIHCKVGQMVQPGVDLIELEGTES